MNPRILIARFLIKLGRFIQELAVTVMRPDDLVEFSRQSYARTPEVIAWGEKKWIERGLTPEETRLVEKTAIEKGKLLILGGGGGREAIFFARKGIDVTAIDYVAAMVDETRKNAERYGVNINASAQEMSTLNLPDGFYDFIWISMGLYSAVPTAKRRVNMLNRIRKGLKPKGYLFCQFHWDPKKGASFKAEFAKKVFAFLTLGNFGYEKGDMLWGNTEFLHAFTSEDSLRTEFDQRGYKLITIHLNKDTRRAGAILQKTK